MLLTIEKVFILKSVSIFARIPEEALIDAAAVVEEVECAAGTVVVKKGDIGTSMYVVVEGRVRVQDDGAVLGEMKAGEVFGELSALDPQPRSATVTAVEDAYLFKMSQQSIYELMAQHTELAQGIIRVLCQRIRDCPKFIRPAGAAATGAAAATPRPNQQPDSLPSASSLKQADQSRRRAAAQDNRSRSLSDS